MSKIAWLFCTSLIFISGQGGAQQHQISMFGGVQEAPHSTVTHGSDSFVAGWEGRSLSSPLYYGVRYVRWINEKAAWSINFTHSKAYADEGTLEKNGGYSVLEFTDGSNPLTINYIRKLNVISGFDPYVSFGAGISIPHVEIRKNSETSNDTSWGYQFGGPVLRASAGVSRPINNRWSIFGEYDIHYILLDVKHGAGRFKTKLIHNSLNLGISYSF
jgi:lipid A oxidase